MIATPQGGFPVNILECSARGKRLSRAVRQWRVLDYFSIVSPDSLVYCGPMLPEKRWKTESILRLFARLVICIFMGSLVESVADFFRQPHGNAAGFMIVAVSGFGSFVGALAVLWRRWELENFGKKALVLLVCFYGGLTLTWWSLRWHGHAAEAEGSPLEVLIAVLAFHGAALVLVHSFLREHQTTWASAFGFNYRLGFALLLGLGIAVVFVPLGWGLQDATARVFTHFHVNAPEQQAVQVLRESHSVGNRLLLAISAILIAPVAEEILFRGVLYPAIKQRGFPQLAFWGTSILFGAIHFNVATLLPLIVLSLMLTWLYERAGNLLAPITAHIFFNALNFAAVFVMRS
ncbi:MAG TPA: CPBP family intramembrane glutamic endopeptidase [Verrucomicrobiae bacterium]|nr:CPBP family intramembrane glutamic endopeptidase [Verrucomicrobiae bacterium]